MLLFYYLNVERRKYFRYTIFILSSSIRFVVSKYWYGKIKYLSDFNFAFKYERLHDGLVVIQHGHFRKNICEWRRHRAIPTRFAIILRPCSIRHGIATVRYMVTVVVVVGQWYTTLSPSYLLQCQTRATTWLQISALHRAHDHVPLLHHTPVVYVWYSVYVCTYIGARSSDEVYESRMFMFLAAARQNLANIGSQFNDRPIARNFPYVFSSREVVSSQVVTCQLQ